MPIRPGPTEPSPFAAIAHAFNLLTGDPNPLSLDTTTVAGLPDRPVPLNELRSRLLHPSCRYATRDATITLLIDRARRDGGPWTVGLVGVLLPGLRRAVTPLITACPGKAADLEAEMLAGLLGALAPVPSRRERPASWLCGRAFDAAKQLLRDELAERARPAHQPVSAEPPRLFGHPDLVLRRAVDEGVICAEDAELIGVTRLEAVSLADAAVRWGLSYAATERRRHRAESALVAWIRNGFVADPPRSAGSKGAGRPRQGHRPDQQPGPRQPPEPSTRARR